MPLGEELDLPVPPELAGALGYPCLPAERYVCFFWMRAGDRGPLDLVWFDGVTQGFGDHQAWAEFVNHWLVAPVLVGYELGGRNRGRAQPSRDCLLLDSVENRLYAAPVFSAYALVQSVGEQSLRSLQISRHSDYLSATQLILRQPIDRLQMDRRREAAIVEINKWLEINGLPF
jgi:hypothetical protein